ncbi:MAG TPA: hypothetical protein VHD56_01095 [Tepidisphaeraceae bacterium]|nr:hypothetical protein [Tepidisphaeraceae bacterium]
MTNDKVYSFRVVAANDSPNDPLNEDDSLPIRVYTGADKYKIIATNKLAAEEKVHQGQPYYSSSDAEFFDMLAESLSGISVVLNNDLALPTSASSAKYHDFYDRMDVAPAPSQLDVVHELVHATDDRFSWYSTTAVTESSERLAYGAVEQMIYKADNSSGLSVFANQNFTTISQAQSAWNLAWSIMNNISATVFWQSTNPLAATSGPLVSADVIDASTKMKIKFSAAQLRLEYNKWMLSQGFAPNALNNAFSFTLDPAFQ